MTKKVLFVLLLLPLAAGHSSPDPLDVEIHMVADEAEDYTAFYDGWDIQDIYVREAFVRPTSEDGIIVRFILYGGFPETSVAAELSVALDIDTPNGTQSFIMSTDDGVSWEGDMNVLESDMEPAEVTGTQGSVQAFITYDQLGVEIGQDIGNFVAYSFADDELRDQAPGPQYVPGTGGQVAIPESGGSQPNQAITLQGPLGYMESTLSANGEELTIEVENKITVIGQHFVVDLFNTDGWATSDVQPAAASVEPGVHPNFTLTATPSEDAGMLELHVTSDLGGREILLVHPPSHSGSNGVVVGEPQAPEDTEKDTPVPQWLGLAAIGAAAILARRRAF